MIGVLAKGKVWTKRQTHTGRRYCAQEGKDQGGSLRRRRRPKIASEPPSTGRGAEGQLPLAALQGTNLVNTSVTLC